jgi:hypothetical protein
MQDSLYLYVLKRDEREREVSSHVILLLLHHLLLFPANGGLGLGFHPMCPHPSVSVSISLLAL